jgi:predicted transcriptional regulator of viral defense system
MVGSRVARAFALRQVASCQGGYFTASQARDAGYSYQAQAHHVAAGNWLRVHRGIFRIEAEPYELHDDKFQWILWSKGRAVISHETALNVHEVGELESAKTHVTAPPGFTMRHRALTIHQATLEARDVDARFPFPVTTVLRSIVDVAAVHVDGDQLERLVDEAVAAGHCTVLELRQRSEAIDLRAALDIERALSSIGR